MPRIPIKLVLSNWLGQDGKSVYSTKIGIEELAAGDLHSGSTFNGEIELDEDDAERLSNALKQGYSPVFWIAPTSKGI